MDRAKTKRRLSRSDVLWWLGSFVAAQLALAVVLEYWGIGRDPNFAFRQFLLNEGLKAEPDRPLLLVLGTSRSMYGVRPDVIEAENGGGPGEPFVFNFSIPSRGLAHKSVELKHLLRDGVRPAALVLEIVPVSLAMDPEPRDYVPAHLHSWADLTEHGRLRDAALPIYRDWLAARLVPTFGYRFELLGRLAPRLLPAKQEFMTVYWRGLDRRGWLGMSHVQPWQEAIKEHHDLFAPNFQAFKVAASHRRSMEQILEICRREGIPLTVLLMPESPTFRSWYTPQAKAGCDEFFADLRARGVRVIDAREWFDDEELFLDGHHLEKQGAAVFSKRLAAELRPLYARLRAPDRPAADSSR